MEICEETRCGRFCNWLTGQRIGQLTVKRFFRKLGKSIHWIVVCDCGHEFSIDGKNVTRSVKPQQACKRCKYSETKEARQAGFWLWGSKRKESQDASPDANSTNSG